MYVYMYSGRVSRGLVLIFLNLFSVYENTSLLHVKSNASIVLKKVSEISKFNHVHQKSKQLNIIMPNTIAQKSVSFRTYLMPSTQNAIK